MSNYEKSIVIPAGIAGIQAPWMDLSLPSMALDARIPAGMTVLRKSEKVELNISPKFPV